MGYPLRMLGCSGRAAHSLTPLAALLTILHCVVREEVAALQGTKAVFTSPQHDKTGLQQTLAHSLVLAHKLLS